MDRQVELAMAKWPNVPDCYGWLALDARGNWRMRDQRCQEQGLAGSKITNLALREFINRNYLCDPGGRYFFQNGPQRVFVELESTPYIAQHDPRHGWVLHTGQVLEHPDAVWALPDGQLVLSAARRLALIDDRDMAVALSRLAWHDRPASDEQVLEWLAQPCAGMTWTDSGCCVPVQHTSLATLAGRPGAGFVSSPAQTSSR